jgi:hypothetical protein
MHRIVKRGFFMDYKCIYELTVRCTAKECEEDLAVHSVTDIDEEFVYFVDKKVLKDKLMEPDAIKREDEEFIYRMIFFGKESAIVWVREVFVKIHEYGTKEMYEAVKEEWQKFCNYDCKWFTGGQKVEEWREEMKAFAEKL